MEGVEVGRAGHGFPWQKTGAAQPRFPLFGALPRGPSAASGGRSEAPSSSRNNSKKMVISVSPPQLETSRRNGPPASLPLRFLSSTPGAARAQEALPGPEPAPGCAAVPPAARCPGAGGESRSCRGDPGRVLPPAGRARCGERPAEPPPPRSLPEGPARGDAESTFRGPAPPRLRLPRWAHRAMGTGSEA